MKKINRYFLIAACAVLICFGAIQQTNAQSRCEKFGLSETKENLNGYWKLEHSNGLTRHVTALVMEGSLGYSVTEYYDTNAKRTRRIEQAHLMCQSSFGIVIIGFNPVDKDTGARGSSLPYNADNFFLTRDTDGKLIAFNRDDGKNGSEVKITFLSNLPKNKR